MVAQKAEQRDEVAVADVVTVVVVVVVVVT
jgi:hypothetical protein